MAADSMTRRYDLLRSRAVGAAQEQNQDEQDALKRRFAAMGGLNSGAALKQSQIASDKNIARAQAAREGVDIQEMGERAQLEEAERGRTWQSGEAEKQRGWQTGESAIQRKFLTGEREGGQTWQSGENATQRTWQSGEREAGQQYDWEKYMDDKGFRTAWAERNAEFQNKNYDLAMKQFGLEKDVADFNKDMAERMMNEQSWMDRLGGAGTKGWKWLFGGGDGEGGQVGGFVGSTVNRLF